MDLCKIFLCICLCVRLPFVTCQELKRNNVLDFPSEPPENTANIIISNGYPAEEHEIVTEDGYILNIYRIPNNKSKRRNGAPVLLMHGLFSCSGDYINMYTNISLGYVLWDRGYDVWLGNARGNSYCKKHVRIDESKNPKEFYNFSWHEIGKYDIPAMIDYIINKTNHKKIYYVGHSQGGTSFYVTMSVRPEYNKKIRLALLMAPAAVFSGASLSILRSLSMNLEFYQHIVASMGLYQIPYLNSLRGFLRNFCNDPKSWSDCKEVFTATTAGAGNDDQMIQSAVSMIFRTSPSDISAKQAYHYLQLIKSGKFCEYDYGAVENMKIYGRVEPPEYNISKITAPIAIYYAENDIMVNIADVKKFIKKLPNVVMDYVVPYANFNHVDFLWGRDLNKLLYVGMFKLMKKY